MSQRSSKFQQGAVTPLQIKFGGGLNYAQSPSQIADNELCSAINVLYNSQTETLETRPGTLCVTLAPLPAAIRKIYYYEKSPTQSWLLAVAGLKLYRLDVDHWHEIGTNIIKNTDVIPTFITFNTLCIIADGSTNLRTWDGSTLLSLADGLSANAIVEVGARVVINSATDPDLVTFSGVENETMWNTADLTNPAIGLRAGFGDNMIVNGFAIFGSDLLISKKGDAQKYIYRIDTKDVPANWTIAKLTANNASQNAHTFCSAFNNIFFVDTNGFKSIQGVTQYGDLQVDMIGSKVNTAIGTQACLEVSYLPIFTAVWYIVTDTIYCYHRLFEPNGQIRHSFTSLQFEQGQINSITQAGSTVYLAGNNGYLYKLGTNLTTDEITPGVTTAFPTLMVSKRFNFPRGGLLTRTSLDLKALEDAPSSLAYLRINTAELDGILLKTINVKQVGVAVFDMTFDLYDWITPLSDMSNLAWSERTTNRARGTSIQFQIDSTDGRFGVEGLQAEIAQVGS